MYPFTGEIRIFAGNFAPFGWAVCNGQLLPIQQYTALFSLLGNIYGGDGRTNFALPNLQNSAPLQQGQGFNLPSYFQGQSGGAATVTLVESQLPAHIHPVRASTSPGSQLDPNGRVWSTAGVARGTSMYTSPQQSVQMSPNSLSAAGGGLPHNNMMPYLALTFIIALQGIYPTRE